MENYQILTVAIKDYSNNKNMKIFSVEYSFVEQDRGFYKMLK
jgi:hypothetical protein